MRIPLILFSILLNVFPVPHVLAFCSLEEMHALSGRDIFTGQSFSLTGEVTCIASPTEFVLDDGTGRCILTAPAEILPTAGDSVAVTGTLTSSKIRRYILSVSQCTRLGHHPAPSPKDTTPRQMCSGALDLHLVSLCGTMTESFPDNIDTRYVHVFVSAEGETVDVGFLQSQYPAAQLQKLVNAEVKITGLCCPSLGGWRTISRRRLLYVQNLEIIRQPPTDPFEVLPLQDISTLKPDRLLQLGRCRIDGQVRSVSRRSVLTLAVNPERTIRVRLASGQALPNPGDTVRVAGLPDADAANIILCSAIWRHFDLPTIPDVQPIPLTPDSFRRNDLCSSCDGQPVRVRGRVRDKSNPASNMGTTLLLACGNTLLQVDGNSCPAALDAIDVDSTVEVTGVFQVETESWSRKDPLPKVSGFSVILRGADDIMVVAHAPWLTVNRLLLLVGSLVFVLVGILIWNFSLRHLVEKRSRQLSEENIRRATADLKVYERTRLAVELHDSIAQNLTGIAFEINAANRSVDQEVAKAHRHLETASKSLKSCREELRYCLWDLRNSALESEEMDEAIRQTLAPHIRNIDISVRFNVPRDCISDNTAHAILRIIRELSVNAVRHGGATSIKIAGCVENGQLMFSVRDNGCGFDPKTCPGVEQGHFGLLGIQERIESFEGKMKIESTPGKGTRVQIILDIPKSSANNHV